MVDVFLYDEIGPSAYGLLGADIIAKEIKTAKNEPIRLRINSPGGSVFEATAMLSLLKEHKPGVDVIVDGIAASAASFLAMVGKTITMAEGSMMMIHRAIGFTIGNAAEHAKSIELLGKVDGQITSIYANRTGRSEADIGEMLDAETWMTSHEALAAGFATHITGPSGVKNVGIKAGRFAKTPAALLVDELPREKERKSIQAFNEYRIRLTMARG
jgi:ATP-dependent Clp protease protease subunit